MTQFVCPQCLEDTYLKEVVDAGAEALVCTYCSAKSPHGFPLAAPIDVVIQCVESALRFEYSDPAEVLPFESAEGGFQGQVHTTDELVADLEICENEVLVADISGAIDQDLWCRRNYFSLSKEEMLIGSWEAFCKTVKHRLRYLFVLPNRGFPKDEEYLSPISTLLAVSEALVHTDSFETLRAGSLVYRARAHKPTDAPRCARKLGTPLPGVAKFANRLSAAGIPVFYGCLEPKTCLVETKVSNNRRHELFTVGRFRLKTDLTLIDLVKERELPSIFDEERRDLRPVIRFLERFADEVAKPVTKDGREHVEYVPTQIVTEYLRHYVGSSGWASEMAGPKPLAKKNAFMTVLWKSIKAARKGTKFDGILYLSAQCSGGTCCGLFVDAKSCVDPAFE